MLTTDLDGQKPFFVNKYDIKASKNQEKKCKNMLRVVGFKLAPFD